MSSGRGPGVIGMVMALIVLLGFGLLFMFAFDEGLQGGDQSIESIIAHQAKDIIYDQQSITAGRESLAQAPTKLANIKELSRLKRENEALETNIVQLVSAVATGKTDVVKANDVFEAYKDQYRAFVRNKAKGESIEKLETLSGVNYLNVNIREVTAIGIQIRHEGGQKRIAFEDLPAEMRDRFQFDQTQKQEALAQEAETRENHEAAVAVAETMADQQMDQKREMDTAKAKAKSKRAIVMKEVQIKSLEDEIHSLNAELNQAAVAADAARAAGRMHLNKSNGISVTIRSKQNRIVTLKSEINQLRSAL